MKKILAVSLLLILGLCSALGAEELPFGMQMNYPVSNSITGGALDSLKDSLGVNVLYSTDYDGRIPYNRIETFHDSGFEVIPYMTDTCAADTAEAFQNYLKAHYFVIGAGDDTSGIRFYARHGTPSDSGWYVSSLTDTDSIFLDSLHYLHEWNFYGRQVVYQPFLCMRLFGDSTAHDSVAIFNVFKSYGQYWECLHDSLVISDTIWANNFSSGRLDTIDLADFGDNNACNWCGANLVYQIKTTHARSFAIKWLKVYNDLGKQLMEDTASYAKIRQYARTHTDVFAWQLRDDMKVDQMMPAHRVDELISEGTEDTIRGMMKYCPVFITSQKDFINIAQPKRFWIDPYPFYGGGSDWVKTLYYGCGIDTIAHTAGLQYILEGLGDDIIAPIRSAAGNNAELWFMAQMQAEEVDNAPGTYTHRWPTASEMRCEAGLALSFGVDAIQYWPYARQGEGSGGITDHGLYQDTDGHNVDITVWNKIARCVTPYVKAIDENYNSLKWDTSYAYHHSEPEYDPPFGALISSISGLSNPDDSKSGEDPPENPDLGWFQVGEFDGPTGDSAKYIIIVNRACSKDDDGNPAPSITAVIYFNPVTLSSNNLFIVDLAHSVYYDSTAHEWKGVQDTTYSDTLNGTIPYLTTFEPGEGRLFKLIKTGRLTLSDSVNTNYTYQGNIKITGDAIVGNGDTMKVQRPARLEFCRQDDQHSGHDLNLTELIVNGSLVATGTSLCPVVFCPDTTAACDTFPVSPPQSGDWYGIHIDTAASCSLSFCSIGYAEYGLESRNNSHVYIDHSNISNNGTTGLYCYKGYLTTAHCQIDSNDVYGVYGLDADVDVDYSSFIDNRSGGIRLSGKATPSHQTSITYDTLTLQSVSSATPAIYLASIDSGQVYKCRTRDYQTGLYLSSSDLAINNDDFSSCTTYGIYADNGSNPGIKQCRLDTLTIGVKSQCSKPFIGKNAGMTVSPGLCTFLAYGAGSHYIYHEVAKASRYDTLYAESNYLGSGRPDTSKF